jgi:hypothetical protein
MTDHPITPPPELVEWLQDLGNLDAIALAYQAGADQELEACCTELDQINCQKYWSERLRAVRRPKPPSLKEQALKALHSASFQPGTDFRQIDPTRSATIRRALEALPDD